MTDAVTHVLTGKGKVAKHREKEITRSNSKKKKENTCRTVHSREIEGVSHFPLSLAYKGIGVVWGDRKRVSKNKDPQRSVQKHAVIWTARYSHIVSDGRLQSSAQIAHKYIVYSARLPRAFGLCPLRYFVERTELVFGTGYCIIRAICGPNGSRRLLLPPVKHFSYHIGP